MKTRSKLRTKLSKASTKRSGCLLLAKQTKHKQKQNTQVSTPKVPSQRRSTPLEPNFHTSLNLTPLLMTFPQHLMTTVGRSLTKSLISALGASSLLSWVSPMALPPTSSTSPLVARFLQVMSGRWRLNTSNGTALCLVTLVLFSALPLTPSHSVLLM